EPELCRNQRQQRRRRSLEAKGSCRERRSDARSCRLFPDWEVIERALHGSPTRANFACWGEEPYCAPVAAPQALVGCSFEPGASPRVAGERRVLSQEAMAWRGLVYPAASPAMRWGGIRCNFRSLVSSWTLEQISSVVETGVLYLVRRCG